MKLLLDTHIFLLALMAPERLHASTRAFLEAAGHTLYLSAASGWEISLAVQSGAVSLPAPPGEYVENRMERAGITPLPLTHAHMARAAGLPVHHTDAVDRFLAAQTLEEGMVMLSDNPVFKRYGVKLAKL